jgi:predicted MFS family arabinose efflux permease
MLPGHMSAIAGVRPARKTISCARTANASNGSDLTSYTFSSQSFGAVATGTDVRWIMVAASIGAGPSGNAKITSMTIGGVEADIVGFSTIEPTTGTLYTVIAIALVPTGTTGNVVVTITDGTAGYCGIVVYRVLNLQGTKESEDKDAGVNPSVFDMSFSAGSLVLGLVSTRNSSTATWVNLTEDYDDQVDASNRRMTVAFDVKTDDGSSTITCTNLTDGAIYRGLCVSFLAAVV